MKCDERELVALLALNRIFPYSSKVVRELIEKVGSGEEVIKILPTLLEKRGSSLIKKMKERPTKELLEVAKRELEWCRESAVSILTYKDPLHYPKRVLESCDPPLILFKRGKLNLNEGYSLSIVGSRRATNYGVAITKEIVRGVAAHFPKCQIVSGLAYGIDITAHKAALTYSLPTVAVVGSGPDKVYPASHTHYAGQIIESGALLTEFSKESSQHKINFIRRNRTIASLSDGVIVVESRKSGGALITASLAAGYHREVFAVPGRVGDPLSEGCNQLVADNRATLFTTVKAMGEVLGWESYSSSEEFSSPSLFAPYRGDKEKILLALHHNGESDIETISNYTAIPLNSALSLLLELQLAGEVDTRNGRSYHLTKIG